MSQEPRYEVYRFRDDIKALQEKAIVEVLTSSPSGGQLRLYSYGLDNSCEELSDGVIRGMASIGFHISLRHWLTKYCRVDLSPSGLAIVVLSSTISTDQHSDPKFSGYRGAMQYGQGKTLRRFLCL